VIRIKGKVGRAFAALILAFAPALLLSDLAHASDLEVAEQALLAGQQEVADATIDKDEAQLVVDSASSAVAIALTDRDDAQIAYDNSATAITTIVSSGVSVSAYINITRTPDPSWLCSSFTSADIAFQWGSGGISGCQADIFSVNFIGSITIPQSGYYSFLGDADDGFYMNLNGVNIIDDWYDKGGWGNWSVPQYFEVNSVHNFDIWYYENGGGAAATLRYYFEESKDAFAEGIVPSSWFSETTTTTTKDEELLNQLNEKEYILSMAIAELADATAALQDAELRLSNAVDAIPALMQAVEEFYIIYEPTNLVAVANNDGSISLNWDAAYEDLVPVERYAVFFFIEDSGGWAISSTTNSAAISSQLFEDTGGLDVEYTFKIRSDNDSLSKYSAWSNVVSASPNIYVPPKPEPTPEPEPVATQEPQPTPEPETAQTEPSPNPAPAPQPVAPAPVAPSPEPQPTTPESVEPEPQPEPKPEAKPEPELTLKPTPSPTTGPKPAEPAPAPAETAKPTVQETKPPKSAPSSTPVETVKPSPTPKPSQTSPAPSPSPKPTETPKPLKEEKPIVIIPVEPTLVVESLLSVDLEVQQIAPEQIVEIRNAVEQVFNELEKDSEQYEEALEALAVIAVADDKELPEELAAIPVVGAVAGQVLDVLNDLGNIGADMSPEQRETSEETVVAAVIVGQVAQLATATAASAGISAAASTRRI
jgi:hypothetical protein